MTTRTAHARRIRFRRPLAREAQHKRLDDYPETLSVDQVAEILDINRNTAYNAIHAGKIPSLQFGRRIVIPRRALELMLTNPTNPVDF